MSLETPVHVPVMLDRVIAILGPALTEPGAVIVDGTLGLGGHAESFLTTFPDVHLVGLDRDLDALAFSRDRLARFEERTTLVHAIYDEMPEVLADLGIPHVQAILLDLGVSSMQLDDDDRGFSYSRDASLDMRMNQSTGLTAADVLNTYSADDLARVLYQYGEEKFARRIAASIVRERATAPFTTSARLVDIVRNSIPAAARRTGGNPAKRTFQALRIEVNGELDALRAVMPAALNALAIGGRLAVLTYQSLEDRIVKHALAAASKSDVPVDMPVIPEGYGPWLKIVTRGGEQPTEREIAENPRAASARLRAAERIAEGVAA